MWINKIPLETLIACRKGELFLFRFILKLPPRRENVLNFLSYSSKECLLTKTLFFVRNFLIVFEGVFTLVNEVPSNFLKYCWALLKRLLTLTEKLDSFEELIWMRKVGRLAGLLSIQRKYIFIS